MEIGFWIAERRRTQCQKPIHVPAQQYVLGRVEIDREIEEIRHIGNGAAISGRATSLQYVKSFDDQDVGPVNLDPLVRNHVVDEMRIDRSARRPPARLDVRQKTQ